MAPGEAPDDGAAPRRWGLGDVAFGLVPTALSAVVFLSTLGSDDPDPEITVAALVVNSLLLWVFLVGAPLYATTRKGGGPARDLGLRFRWVDLAAVPLGVALQAVVVPALYWPILKVLDRSEGDVENEARELVDAASGPGILLLVLVVGLGAPFAEELFYRGLLLRAVEKRWTLAAGAVAATVDFALAHLQGIQLPALLLFGAVASYLAVRTGRLGPSILCHVGFNAWTLFLLLVLDP
jgi:membrane protease YdiL (CAAX protease family)